MIVSNKSLIMVVLLYTFCTVFRNCSATPDIDQEHLTQVPDCGIIKFKTDWHEVEDENPSSRISNAQEATMHYPWVIRVHRIFGDRFQGEKLDSCGGTLLTKRLRKL